MISMNKIDTSSSACAFDCGNKLVSGEYLLGRYGSGYIIVLTRINGSSGANNVFYPLVGGVISVADSGFTKYCFS